MRGFVICLFVLSAGAEEGVHPSTEAFARACELQAKGRYKSAQRAFGKLLDAWPDSPHAAAAADRSGDNAYLGTETLWRGGPSARRIDVAVMGDGFPLDRAAQRKQEKWARLCVDVLWNSDCYSEYRSYFNFHFVRLASLDEGVDPNLSPAERAKIEKKNRTRRGSRKIKTDFSTALDAKAAGPQGQVMCDRALVMKWLEVADRDVPGVGDDKFVIAFAQFGKLGMGGGGIANVGRPDKSVTTHEFGHAFARLLDEYTGNPNPPPQGMLGAQLRAANASLTPDPEQVPWAHFLEARVKGVGVYEGGATYNQGVWRPARTCAMNAAGAVRYCPVCREATVLAIYEHVDPIDACAPPPEDELTMTEGEKRVLSVTAMRPRRRKLAVTWHVAPRAVTAATAVEVSGTAPPAAHGWNGAFAGPRAKQDRSWYARPPRGEEARAKTVRTRGAPDRSEFPLHRLAPGTWEITCRVVDETPWVLKDPAHLLEERVRWHVTVVAAPE